MVLGWGVPRLSESSGRPSKRVPQAENAVRRPRKNVEFQGQNQNRDPRFSQLSSLGPRSDYIKGNRFYDSDGRRDALSTPFGDFERIRMERAGTIRTNHFSGSPGRR